MDVRERSLGLLGVLAVAYQEGARLGKVSDIFVDRKGCRVTGLAISTGLPGFDSTSFVDFKHVRILGKDVVIVSDQKAVTPLAEGVSKTSLKLLRNVRIATRDGVYIGRLQDVSVDVSTGNITQLMLSDRDYVDIAVRATAIGADIIVLPSDVKTKTKKAKQDEGGAMTAESVTSALETATNRVLQAAKGTTEKVIETTKRTANQAREAMRSLDDNNKAASGKAPAAKAALPQSTASPANKVAKGTNKKVAKGTKKKTRRRAGLPRASRPPA